MSGLRWLGERKVTLPTRVPSQSKSISKYLPYKESTTFCYVKLYRGFHMTKTTMWRISWSGCVQLSLLISFCHQKSTHLKDCVKVLDGFTPKWILIRQTLSSITQAQDDVYQNFLWPNLDCHGTMCFMLLSSWYHQYHPWNRRSYIKKRQIPQYLL